MLETVPLGLMQDMLAHQRAELLEDLRKGSSSAFQSESKARRSAASDRKRAYSRLAEREVEHEREIAATELVFTSDLAAQEAATKEVTQALRRKEAMIARRDDKLMDAGALLKESVRQNAEAMTLLMREVELS